ncbi:hypothetical protein DFP72DRAFT_829153 [Ephemerocybe angulata]|uniref:Reverse transcriptase zinc-binding domain-containing protein n=1 Tax=Ephemerocybe angulata TaxID=980116 RepID=A0A8H6LUT6_9AGAR|nr:hypothetical protein DFP72DRAFT_829153 [Tulosesus angulatus]
MGAKSNTLTQAQAYRAIRGMKTKEDNHRTTAMVERTKAAVSGVTGIEQKSATLWKSLRQRKKGTLTHKFSVFAWKALHDGHKVGKFWKHINEDRMICQPCNANQENLEHIMQHCRVSGQETVWKAAKEAWSHTGLEWPEVNLEIILGIGMIEIKGRNGETSTGRTRLFKILISESAYLIWLLRCEWRIGREQNTLQIHTKHEIIARWKLAIARRLRLDWALTSKLSFGKKALNAAEVKRAWKHIADHAKFGTLRDDLVEEGVLVGSAVRRRPPGRNR